MKPRPGRSPIPDILHCDDALVVVNKPPGVLSTPGRGASDDVRTLLRGQGGIGPDETLRVVHRLDAEASGVLVFARTLAAQRALVEQFANRSVEKTYLVLVSGYVPGPGDVDLALTFDRRRNRVRAHPTRGKPSLTRFRLAQRLPGNTLLECQLVTGRKHQIRAHMAAIGYPLTVDPLYGGGDAVLLSNYKPDYRPSARRPERPLIDRLTLHAARIAFDHPVSGVRVRFAAPLPKDFQATIRQLERLMR